MRFMHTRSKLLLAALTAALALTLGATTANASRSFSATNNTLLTYVSPGLTFGGVPSGSSFICPVTLTASLHSVAAKVAGTLIGFVNGSRFGRCTNSVGTDMVAIPLVSHVLPWHITYNSFRGTLPRITEILFTINRAKFLLETFVFELNRQNCLYQANILVDTSGTTGAAEYTVRLLIPQGREGLNVVPLFENGLNRSFRRCETSLEFLGTFHATLPPVIRLL
jgi:hypothetical protein